LTRWTNIETLLDTVSKIGSRLIAAQPKELAVGNIVRRVLKIIREVACEKMENNGRDDDSPFDDDSPDESPRIKDSKNKPSPTPFKESTFLSQSSMFNLLSDRTVDTHTVTKDNNSTYSLKPIIIQEINEEIISDLETVYKGIADQATDYIHANEVIMTIGKSRTVEDFLIRAINKFKFQVIVAETSPTYQGQEMARNLAAAGIDTTIICDSAIFAAMPRVNKVLLGAHAVLANGGLVAVTGSHLLAAAAKHHSTPVLVCTALYKLSPLIACDADAFNVTVSPQTVFPFQEGSIVDDMTISNPYYDYVEPDLVSLFIHNLGSAPPTYIYRLINDNYDPRDNAL
ncbi:hypothetical protein BDB01DRAFT_689296, partial [Pilobolus umbonatus]